MLARCGGAKRLLLMLPRKADATRWRQLLGDEFGEKVSIVPAANADIAMCQEAEGLSAVQVGAVLLEHHPDCAKAAKRLHTRVDVEWRPLPRPTSK